MPGGAKPAIELGVAARQQGHEHDSPQLVHRARGTGLLERAGYRRDPAVSGDRVSGCQLSACQGTVA